MAIHSDHYALVVGIDHYPKYRPLEGARADASRFHTWLKDKAIGGGVPDANIRLVLSTPDPVRPIHENIDDALEEIIQATEAKAGERLYIYFSGHGLARSNVGADLCLAKWSKRRRGRALDSLDYLKLISGSGHFREIVMFLDCCRVRQVRTRSLMSTLDFPRPDEEAAFSRSFVGYATEFMNAAFEAEIDGNDQDEIRGHFTTALVDALNGRAADAPGGVRASRLKEYLELQTPIIARAANHLQKPEVQNGLPSDPEPVFGSAPPAAEPGEVTVNITFAQWRSGEVILEDANLDEVRRGDATSGPWQVPLTRGLYLLRGIGNDEEQSLRVTGDEEGGKDVQF